MTQTKANKAKRQDRRDACPTPTKGAYDTEAAVHKALRSSRFSGRPIRIYECDCGSIHLTKRVVPIKGT